MHYTVRGRRKHIIRVERKGAWDNGPVEIPVGKRPFLVEVDPPDAAGALRRLKINHRHCPVEVEQDANGLPRRVILRGTPFDISIERVESTRYRPPQQEREISGEMRALLPGQIVEIFVREGDPVEQGQPVMTLEAMKMENGIFAPKGGRVSRICIPRDAIVRKGDLLFVIE